MESGVRNDRDLSLYLLIDNLFRKPVGIIDDLDTLTAILALAPEIEAYRGKGSQLVCRGFYQRLSGLVFHAQLNPPSGGARDACLEALGSHLFQRVQGPPVRSELAARLRSVAWFALGELSGIQRNPEHLAHALKTAANPRASEVEHEAAIQFLGPYWGGDDPDEATADLLFSMEKNPANRDLLVTILQTQIDLGLNDGFGALCAVDDWDDADEEE